MYENNYPNNSEHTYHYETPTPKTPVSPEKKHSLGVAQKLIIGICCGLLFGIFAGLGFQAVGTASDFLKETTGAGHIRENAGVEASEDKEKAAVAEAGSEKQNISEQHSTSEQPNEAEQAASDVQQEISETRPTQAIATDVTQVVKEVMPAVVSINNKYVETMSFFGQDYSNESVSTGSGIIVGQNDSELLLVSNYHVVASADELTVQFVDGSQVQAQIKGTDMDKDLAVIAVQLGDIDNATKNNIAIAKLGDSSALIVGEPVIAIGNALGYGQSVTTGVVSALNRPIAANNMPAQEEKADTEINTFIQTDAAINPGNSGGALLDINGEVIGINSNKIGGNIVEGMGYAIPITDAKPIIEKLMTKETRLKVEETSKGYLGITGVDVVQEYSDIYGIPKGVYISSVIAGSGADRAGLAKGNIITAVNDESVTSMDELKEELGYYTAGTQIELTIMQGSPDGYKPVSVKVTLGKQQ